jgi:hypothetical protein
MTIRAKRRTLRRVVHHAVALVLSALLFLLGLETVLRLGARWLAPRLGELGNVTYSRYDPLPGDIYFEVPELDMWFMRPDFDTENYFNGYFWHHTTDSRGFRNPPDAQDTSLLVLGDSFVYGHGVEEDQTLTAYLRSLHGRPAYNMGREGACLYQEYVFLRLYIERFRPREVVLVVFVNDFHDLSVYRTREEIETRPEIDQYPYGEALLGRIHRLARRVSLSPWENLLRLRALRLLVGASRRSGWVSLLGPAPPAFAEPPRPGSLAGARAWQPGDPFPEDTLPWARAVLDDATFAPLLEYYRVVLEDLNRRLGERGIRFSVAYIEHGQSFAGLARQAQNTAGPRLYEICRDAGIRYYSLRPALGHCNRCFLPGDGHWTPEGHRRVAALLDRVVLAPKKPDVAGPARTPVDF